MDYVYWNRGLLLAAILIVIGGMAVVSARSIQDRFFAVGVLTQGMVGLFVVSGTFHQRVELAVVAIALMLVSALWCLWDRGLSHVYPLDSTRSARGRDMSTDLPVRDTGDSILHQADVSEGAR